MYLQRRQFLPEDCFGGRFPVRLERFCFAEREIPRLFDWLVTVAGHSQPIAARSASVFVAVGSGQAVVAAVNRERCRADLVGRPIDDKQRFTPLPPLDVGASERADEPAKTERRRHPSHRRRCEGTSGGVAPVQNLSLSTDSQWSRFRVTRQDINLHGEYELPDEKLSDSVSLEVPKIRQLEVGVRNSRRNASSSPSHRRLL